MFVKALHHWQNKIVGFLTNAENARRIDSLVEDTRDAMMDYQVHPPNY